MNKQQIINNNNKLYATQENVYLVDEPNIKNCKIVKITSYKLSNFSYNSMIGYLVGDENNYIVSVYIPITDNRGNLVGLTKDRFKILP